MNTAIKFACAFVSGMALMQVVTFFHLRSLVEEAKTFKVEIIQDSQGPKSIVFSTNFVAKEDKEAAMAWLRNTPVNSNRAKMVGWQDNPEFWMLICGHHDALESPFSFADYPRNRHVLGELATLVKSGFLSHDDTTDVYTVTDAGWELIIARLRQFKLI